jgi:hypothetical protein
MDMEGLRLDLHHPQHLLADPPHLLHTSVGFSQGRPAHVAPSNQRRGHALGSRGRALAPGGWGRPAPMAPGGRRRCPTLGSRGPEAGP